MAKRIAPLFLTLLNDLLGAGIVLTIFAPLVLGTDDFFSIKSSYHIHALVLGLLIGAYPFGQLFGAPLMQEFAKNLGRKNILLISILFGFLAFLLSGVAIYTHMLWLMFVSRLIAGFFSSNRTLAQSAILELATPKNQKFLLLMTTFFIGLGFVLGPFLGGKLSEPSLVSWFDFDVPFILVAFLFLVDFFWIFFAFKETHIVPVKKEYRFKERFVGIFNIYKEKQIGLLFAIFFILNVGSLVFISFFPAFLLEIYKYKQGLIGDMMGYYAFFFVIGPILFHKLFIHLKPEKLLVWPLIFFAVGVYGITFFTEHWLAWVLLPIIGMSNSIYWTAIFILFAKYSPPQIRGNVFGIAWGTWSLAYFLSTAFSGILLAHGAKIPLIFGALVTILGALMYLLFFKTRKTA
ncbi:MAG: Tetracycline resistance protein, class C [Chlamydiae bacterium]|nr:Tetracycline resistance protein, class C [Chlamydiota bacterium]